MSKIATCLWFDGQAEDAARFYMSIFPESGLHAVSRYGEGAHFPAGTALMVAFTLGGQPFQALNGGPEYRFTPAISLSIACGTAAEVDRYWAALTDDGGAEGRCGWLTDRFGVSWQVVPDGLAVLLGDPDPGRAARAAKAMMGMRKIEMAAMRAAADGNTG